VMLLRIPAVARGEPRSATGPTQSFHFPEGTTFGAVIGGSGGESGATSTLPATYLASNMMGSEPEIYHRAAALPMLRRWGG
jgi:hypothetical protein